MLIRNTLIDNGDIDPTLPKRDVMLTPYFLKITYRRSFLQSNYCQISDDGFIISSITYILITNYMID